MIDAVDVSPSAEAIGLDDMTTDELRERLARVELSITDIKEMLNDDTRPDLMGDSYTDWRRRAIWARMKLKKGRKQITAALEVRRIEAREAEKAARIQRHAESVKRGHEQRSRVLSSLGSTGVDGLLLRVRVVLDHLLPPGQPLPEVLTDEDRQTLHLLQIYLRDTYGTSAVRHGRQERAS